MAGERAAVSGLKPETRRAPNDPVLGTSDSLRDWPREQGWQPAPGRQYDGVNPSAVHADLKRWCAPATCHSVDSKRKAVTEETHLSRNSNRQTLCVRGQDGE